LSAAGLEKKPEFESRKNDEKSRNLCEFQVNGKPKSEKEQRAQDCEEGKTSSD